MTSPAAVAAITVTTAPVMIRTRRRRRASRAVRRWRRWEEPSVARSRLVVVPVLVDADYAGRSRKGQLTQAKRLGARRTVVVEGDTDLDAVIEELRA